jgi:hypothetical protein
MKRGKARAPKVRSADDIPCRNLDPLQAILQARRSYCGKGTRLFESESWANYRQSIQVGMEQGCIDHPAKAIDVVDVVVGQEYAVQIGAPGFRLEYLLLRSFSAVNEDARLQKLQENALRVTLSRRYACRSEKGAITQTHLPTPLYATLRAMYLLNTSGFNTSGWGATASIYDPGDQAEASFSRAICSALSSIASAPRFSCN